MRRNVYLRPGRLQVPVFPTKIWGATCIWDLAGRKYRFPQPKYEAQCLPETWPVAGTCFPVQNMKSDVYLRPEYVSERSVVYLKPALYLRPGQLQVPIFPTKIWGAICTWDLAGCKYLFPQPNYEVRRIPETWPVAGTCFPNQNMRRDVYKRPGRSQLPVSLSKIWDVMCTWDLDMYLRG